MSAETAHLGPGMGGTGHADQPVGERAAIHDGGLPVRTLTDVERVRAVRAVVEEVAPYLGIAIIRSDTSRGRQRQVQATAYIAHCGLEVCARVIAREFGRDVTTVYHAIRTIENMREDASVDAALCAIERIARVALGESAAVE